MNLPAAARSLPSDRSTSEERASRELQRLLSVGSRTFALNIPYLRPPLREAMSIAYLLLRNADSLEDATGLPTRARIAGLRELIGLVRGERPAEGAEALAARFGRDTRIQAPGHRAVMLATPFLLAALERLPAPLGEPIRRHLVRSAGRMAAGLGDGRVEGEGIDSLRDLDDYCYSVAGIVGELITDLFVADAGLGPPRAGLLRSLEVDFGVGLQLVNIIKDAGRDGAEGRRFLPPTWSPTPGRPEAVEPLIRLAARRLDAAIDYTVALPARRDDLRRFCLLPVLLAGATLAELRRRMDELAAGGDVRIDRREVAVLVKTVAALSGDDVGIRRAWVSMTGGLRG